MTAVPPDAVEAGARAGWEAGRLPTDPHWSELEPHDRDSHRHHAQLILTAAAPHMAASERRKAADGLTTVHPPRTQTEPGS